MARAGIASIVTVPPHTDKEEPMLNGRRWLPVLAAGLLLLIVSLAGCAKEVKETANLPPLAEDETDPEAFGKLYPRHYDSYKRNFEQQKTEFGGSEPYSKLEADPALRQLFAGYGFSVEYNEDRGHTYSLEDVTKIKRVTPKTTATCFTCKSTSVPGLIKKYGEQYYKKPFSEIKAEMKHSIGCSDCHNPQTMELRISRPAFIEAMSRRGVDVAKATRQDMRSYVCGQCHVEYYFQPDTVKLTFPWDRGFTPDAIYGYYQEKNFKDWEHSGSKAPMLKAQHPEFETFQGSTHQLAKVSCADCHMPYVKEGSAKISSHWWTSPLKTMNESCGSCHRNDQEYLKTRVKDTQEKTRDLMDRAEKTLVEAIEAIDAAAKAGADPKILDEARELHRQGQWQWDWVSAENSMGFHNPQLAMSTLGKAIDLAHQAKAKAAGN